MFFLDAPRGWGTLIVSTNCAMFSPLNPLSPARRVGSRLCKLCPAALLTQACLDLPVLQAARAHSIPIFEITVCSNAPAGSFQFAGEQVRPFESAKFTRPEDVIVLLNTSGTTSLPKLVPLPQSNICSYIFASNALLILSPTSGHHRAQCAALSALFRRRAGPTVHRAVGGYFPGAPARTLRTDGDRRRDRVQSAATGQAQNRLRRLPLGAEITILDDAGNLLPADVIGEIAVRGERVLTAYADGTSVPRTNGWLRSDDIGYLDDEVYLYVTSRVKGIINRGGAKIFPREVEETLLPHDAVAQAVVFAVPEPRLGEVVGARRWRHACAQHPVAVPLSGRRNLFCRGIPR